MRQNRFFITLVMAAALVMPCHAGGGVEGVTLGNYPVTDGSDSTEPLRTILMCRLLGFDYKWEYYSPFLQDPSKAPAKIVPDYTCTKEEEAAIRERLLNMNTHQSFQNLIDGKVELIITARSASRDERGYAAGQGVELLEKPIALDGLTFMVNQENPVAGLTHEEIRAIYTTQITRWSEVGGKDEPISAYIRNRNSGSQEKFETLVMYGLTLPDFPEMRIGRVMSAPYVQIEQDKKGLAFTPFYYYSVMVKKSNTRPLAVNGVAMTKENVANGSYPYITEAYVTVRADVDRSSTAYRIFDFMTSAEGQAIVAESGYVPLDASTDVGRTVGGDVRLHYEAGRLRVVSPRRLAAVRLFKADASMALADRAQGYTYGRDISHLPSGVYIVRVTTEGGVERTFKLAI